MVGVDVDGESFPLGFGRGCLFSYSHPVCVLEVGRPAGKTNQTRLMCKKEGIEGCDGWENKDIRGERQEMLCGLRERSERQGIN